MADPRVSHTRGPPVCNGSAWVICDPQVAMHVLCSPVIMGASPSMMSHVCDICLTVDCVESWWPFTEVKVSLPFVIINLVYMGRYGHVPLWP